MYFSKQLLNKILALCLILILSPFLLLTGILVFLSTNDSPVFMQKRGLSLEGTSFIIYKFRTIKRHKTSGTIDSIFYKPVPGENISKLGMFLRRTGWDEILQLINVMKGEMSFIGPRPLSYEDLAVMKNNYPRLYNLRSRMNIKPGITGYWQILGNRNLGVINLVSSDLFYFNNRSLKLNLMILGLTLKTILTRAHSDSIIPVRKNRFVNKINPRKVVFRSRLKDV